MNNIKSYYIPRKLYHFAEQQWTLYLMSNNDRLPRGAHKKLKKYNRKQRWVQHPIHGCQVFTSQSIEDLEK